MEEPTTFEQETKPQGLKVLCTLTFIYSGIVGFFALSGMLIAKPILFPWLNENYPFSDYPGMTEEWLEQIKKIIELGSNKFIIGCGIYLLIIGLSFFGALQMWQNKYKGFIMYSLANICFLVSNVAGRGYFMAAVDLLFIVLYLRHSKSLEK
ncbi:MAG TPA: hypothetical protein VNX01_11870 [Bacteroidia bacterium]|jgi:hypothetical protein|nr:hypothetical protein [Bacteroidia bacterium]